MDLLNLNESAIKELSKLTKSSFDVDQAIIYFNKINRKKLEIFAIDDNGKKVSEMFSISKLNEIYQYSDKFKAIVMYYEQPQAVET